MITWFKVVCFCTPFGSAIAARMAGHEIEAAVYMTGACIIGAIFLKESPDER